MKNVLMIGALLLLAGTVSASPEKGARDKTDAPAAREVSAKAEAAAPADACDTESSKQLGGAMETDDVGCIGCYYDYYFGPLPHTVIENSDLKFELCKINHCG